MQNSSHGTAVVCHRRHVDCQNTHSWGPQFYGSGTTAHANVMTARGNVMEARAVAVPWRCPLPLALTLSSPYHDPNPNTR